MTQRTVVILEDDLEGGEASETIGFALDGSTYEIDLNEDNVARMRDVMAPYIGAARGAGGPSAGRAARASPRGSGRAKSAPDVEAPKSVRA